MRSFDEIQRQRPNSTEIEELISSIKATDLSKATIEDVLVKLDRLFDGYVFHGIEYDPGLEIYRAIPYDTKPTEFSYLSCPPPSVAKINRASRAGSSMFYGALSYNVPAFELDLQPGQTIVMGKWRTKRRLLVNMVGFTNDNLVRLQSERQADAYTFPSKLAEEYECLNSRIHTFLAEHFSQPVPKDKQHLYTATIAIAEKLFNDDRFEALLYPSIAAFGNSDNLCIKKRFIDSGGLELVHVSWIKVVARIGENFGLNTADFANSISPAGKIEWKGRNKIWTNVPEGFTFEVEDGEEVVRDPFGNIIEPE